MTRSVALYLPVLLSAAATPAMAHEGAGIVHFLAQPDHVIGLVLAVAVPLVVWTLARRLRSRR